ncbi:MAG: hypothetical protein HQK68_06310 [Desulfamplus sp.]|nr:hypothetical protein [Desulfamplus sp.]
MIKFLFHLFLSINFIVIQTSIFPSFAIFSSSFDLLLINILFLSLMFSHYLVIIAVILIGWCMDSLSGAPLGLYTITYLWIFIIVQALKRFVHRGNFIFLPVISAFSVMVENGFLFFSFFIKYGSKPFSFNNTLVAGEQALLAFFIIPLFIVVIHSLHTICDSLDSKGAL